MSNTATNGTASAVGSAVQDVVDAVKDATAQALSGPAAEQVKVTVTEAISTGSEAAKEALANAKDVAAAAREAAKETAASAQEEIGEGAKKSHGLLKGVFIAGALAGIGIGIAKLAGGRRQDDWTQA
jgi:hypothetical protein